MSRLGLAALGSSAALAPLITPSSGSARRFRRVLRVSLQTGGQAHQIVVLSDAVLTVAFSSRAFDSRLPATPEAATLSAGADGLVLRLPVARPITSVRLAQADPGDQVAAFRFDGPVVSEEAVAVGAHAANGALLNVTDAQLILRRRRLGTDLSLAPGDVAGVTVTVSPAQPRVAFAIVGDQEGEVVLPPSTDASGAPVVSNTDSWGPRLAAALTAQLARFAAASGILPDPLLIDLILESDTPCSAAISAFDLGYELIRDGFADGPAKQVLRFAAGRGEMQSVTLDLPNGAIALSAPLRLTLAGSSSAAVRRKAGAGLGADVSAAVSQGVALVPGAMAATLITLEAASVITGADVVAGAIESPAELVASLWNDAGGLPGRPVAESDVVAVASGRPVAIGMTFAPGVVLPAEPMWVGLSVRRGRAVLGLVASDAGLVATGDGAIWSVLGSAIGQTAAIRLRTPPIDNDAATGDSGLAVSLAGATVATVADGRALVAELAGAVNALPIPRPSQMPIQVRADGGGVVTVDPPRMRYVLS